VLRWLKTVVVSDQGKGAEWGALRQVGTRKTFQKRPLPWVSLLTRRKVLDGIESEGPPLALVVSLAGARVPGRVVSGV
jgi:hypothetical protein